MSDLPAPLSVVPYLKVPSTGSPYLEGLRCKVCRAVFIDLRQHCAACGARHSLEPMRLSERGTLHVFTVVYRSFPGVPVPYVSAIVDLDGGGTLKGNLIGVPSDPRTIRMGMKVRVVYELAPAKDKAGNSYMAYFFAPEENAA